MEILPLVIGLSLGAIVTYVWRSREIAALKPSAARAEAAEARSLDLRQERDEVRDRAAALEKRVATAEAAADRTLETEREVSDLRQENTRLEARVAAAEAARKSESDSHAGRVAGLKSRLAAGTAEARDLRQQIHEAGQRAGKAESALASERKSHEARLEEIRTLGKEIERKFGALSARALERSGENFLQLVTERFEQHKAAAERDLGARQKEIRNLVRPLGDTLRDFRKTVDDIEKQRVESHGKLAERLRSLAHGESELRAETRNLVQALRKPQTRGRWGEMQLRRALEMAGLQRNVTFDEQPTVGGVRPDVVLRLPGDRAIVVDAKTPLEGYLDAIEATTEAERQSADQAHARHVREHVRGLASKKYWDLIPESVDFVVLFLPGEAMFARAIETDPGLLEDAVEKRVLISTPTTLIALAKAIAYGWQQQKMARESRKIADLGQDLFKRLRTFAGHLQKTGKSLEQTVKHYNRSVGSWESRLLPAANRFDELHVVPSGSRIEPTGPVSTAVRGLASPEAPAALPEGDRPPTLTLPAANDASDADETSGASAPPTAAPRESSPPAPPTWTASEEQILDNMLDLLRRIEPDVELNPKRNYIGLLVGGRPRNFVRFKRRPTGVLAMYSLSDARSLREVFDARGMPLTIDSRGKTLVMLTRESVAGHADFLLDLARRARDAHRGPGRRPGTSAGG